MSELQTSTVSEVANSNNAASPNGMAEGCAPSTVNDTYREGLAAIVRFFNRLHGRDNSQALLSSTGSVATYALTFTTAPATLFTGMIVTFKANADYAADSTLNINTLGAKNIQKMNASGLANIVAGDILTNQHVMLKYDGTLDKFLMLSPSGSPTALTANNTWTGTQTFSGAVAMTNDLTLDDWQTVASATTTDIGAATSNFVAVSGTATITGLGTDAAGTWRILRATGAWTLTFSATIIGPNGETSGTNVSTAGHMFLAISQGGGTWNIGMFVPRLAGQSSMETPTSNNLSVTPGRMQYHPGVAKAWVAFNGSDGSIDGAHNIPTVTRTGAGLYTVAFTTAFGDANYAVVHGTGHSVNATGIYVRVVTKTTTECTIRTNLNGAATDLDEVYLAFYGDQA